jgi:hypothetical protein
LPQLKGSKIQEESKKTSNQAQKPLTEREEEQKPIITKRATTNFKSQPSGSNTNPLELEFEDLDQQIKKSAVLRKQQMILASRILGMKSRFKAFIQITYSMKSGLF